MKATLLLKGKIRQMVLKPEDKDEEMILKSFAGKENLRTSFGRFEIEQCAAGWLREFDSQDSLIITYNPE